MKTNNDARVWCSENYNTTQEAFYIFNAKKLIFEEWRTSWMHAIASLLITVVGSVFGFIANPLVFLSAMQLGFAFYGILTYCHNDQGAGLLAYLSTLIFFPNVLREASPTLRTVFIIIGLLLLVGTLITEKNYKKVLASYGQTAQRQWANDEEEFEAWRRKYYTGYSRDTSSSNQKQNSNGSDNSNDYQQGAQQESSYTAQRATNKYADQAQALFADFGTTYTELKKKYRKLAMAHHPDRGGEHDMFVAIVAEYEYLKSTRFPNEK